MHHNLNPIHAKEAHSSTTDTYGFVSTESVLATFAAAGWAPVSQQVVKVRKADRQGYQRHLVRLENPEFPEMPGLRGLDHCRPQLVLLNSHDKGSSMRLSWGMFRLVCTNGLVVGKTVGEVRMSHTSKVNERLASAIDSMLGNFPKMVEQVSALRSKELSAAATAQLIKTVYDARLDGVKNLREIEYRLPRVKRHGDIGNDAFTVFNRVQETVIQGGIRYLYDRSVAGRDDRKRLSSGTTRKVSAIEESVRLNTLAYETALALV